MTDGGISRRIFDERACERLDLSCMVRGFGADARDLTLTLTDVSSEGFIARSADVLHTGERVRVALPLIGTQIACIGWVSGNRIGCSFDQPLDRASYYELLAALLNK